MKKTDGIGKKLTDINKEVPFKVPVNYFDTFPVKLANTIRSHDRLPGKKRFLNSWKPYAAAAILIVAAILTGTLSNRNTTKRADQRFYNEISELVENELYSINEQTIVEATVTEDQFTEPDMDADEVIHYLLNGDVENELMDAL